MKIQDINLLKGKAKTAARDWAFCMIDRLTEAHPRLIPIGPYLRRGVTNLISRYDVQMNNAIDKLSLFLCDETGTYDTDMIVDDLVEMFEKMPKADVEVLGALITYGKGEICINLPGGVFMETLLGDLSKISFNSEDIRELKKMFT